MARPTTDPPPPILPPCVADGSVALTHVRANGIRHRIATAGFTLPPAPPSFPDDGDEHDSAASASASAGASAVSSPARRRSPSRPRPPPSPPPVLVMLLHGFPESWYSWRRQLVALSLAGYAACAPDMRGYGGTDSPRDLPSYDVRALALDVVRVAERCGCRRRFVVVGHDFGAYLAWHVALFHPDRVWAVCGMSVPWAGHSPRNYGRLEALRRGYGDCFPGGNNHPAGGGSGREGRLEAKFHYMLHHCLPGAAEEYGRNAAEALYRLYAVRRGAAFEPGTPEVTDRRMFPPPPPPPQSTAAAPSSSREGTADNGAATGRGPSPPAAHATTTPERLDARNAPGLWARLPRPASLPPWLTRYDLDYYASEFTRAGFAGGLKWYQALDMNWESTQRTAGVPSILPPALFLAGCDDDVIEAFGGPGRVRRGLRESCADLRGCVLIEGAGHWIQQERAGEVNGALLEFLDGVVFASTAQSAKEASPRDRGGGTMRARARL